MPQHPFRAKPSDFIGRVVPFQTFECRFVRTNRRVLKPCECLSLTVIRCDRRKGSCSSSINECHRALAGLWRWFGARNGTDWPRRHLRLSTSFNVERLCDRRRAGDLCGWILGAEIAPRSLPMGLSGLREAGRRSFHRRPALNILSSGHFHLYIATRR